MEEKEEEKEEERKEEDKLPYTPHGVLKFSELVAKWLKEHKEKEEDDTSEG